MDIIHIAVLLGILAFFAHIVKGLTGFGPAIVFVSIGSVIHDPVEVIVLSSLLDIIGGSYLLFLNPNFLKNRKYWLTLGLLMVAGAVTGGMILSMITADVFEYLLGGSIIVIGLWFLIGEYEPGESSDIYDRLGFLDGTVAAFSGLSGGLTGMGGPPLIAYLGAKFEKDMFRSLIVPVFLMAAIARFFTYGFLGMVQASDPWLYVFPPIGVILGNRLGDHFFEEVEQEWFTVIIGLILLLSGIRLISGG
ncbi:MAG: sulfite exporter TauE/SafE family protein [Candidatus Nanohaloarchaea archaeon]